MPSEHMCSFAPVHAARAVCVLATLPNVACVRVLCADTLHPQKRAAAEWRERVQAAAGERARAAAELAAHREQQLARDADDVAQEDEARRAAHAERIAERRRRRAQMIAEVRPASQPTNQSAIVACLLDWWR